MSAPVFTINFRREFYRRQLARARRRMMMLGVWLTYFGALAVVLGLYGLNCASLTRRIRHIERQAAQARAAQSLATASRIDETQLVDIQMVQASPGRWRDRLARLAELMPPNAAVTSVAVNPNNLTGADRNVLVIAGQLRGGGDRTAAVVDLVSRLQADSAFATGYRNVRLISSRTATGTGVAPTTEFTIECR